MSNRVYYGEYSLEHWIDLILKKNLVLPEYQRYFVWDEGRVRKLIKTFKDGQFVPPVTIGAFNDGLSTKNLVLDGQQRLTTILLAYLGLYPDKTQYNRLIERYADENDDLIEDEESELDNVFEWTFKKLTKKGNTKEEILGQISDGNYKVINLDITERFLKTTFLGFSYLVPSSDTADQQKFYSSVFRHINIQGVSLLPQESREALYHINQDLIKFFNPDFSHEIKITNATGEAKMDFVRFLSLLSQLSKDGDTTRVARGFKPQMEKYYEDFILAIVDNQNNSLFAGLESYIPDKNYQPKFELISEAVNTLGWPKNFSSIIELDLYFFGLTFVILFESSTINADARDLLKGEIDEKIAAFRGDVAHSKAPGALKYLKSRMNSSIEIYKKYINEQAH